MKRMLIAALCLAVCASCKQKVAKPVPVEETVKPAPEPEPDPRQVLLEAEYDRYDDVTLTHSAADLSDGEKQMLVHLLAAAQLIEELHMLQLHPKNLDWRDAIMASGTDVEKKLFMRYQMPWCADDESPECCALEEQPEKRIGYSHWPKDLTDEEFESLGELENGTDLLSPFTVVMRKKEGGFHALAYSQMGLFAAKMKAVARELDAAGATAPDPSLVKFLYSRAKAFESYDPFPYDESDYDWIALEGDWEVTVGPYETYKNPHQLKALFEMYIGREDKELTAGMAGFKDNLQEMEDSLGELVGKGVYKSRKLDPRIAIRAVDIWMASGDGRRDRGATVAFHLPNRGKSVDEGLYKKVMMINHSMAFEKVVEARAELILVEEQNEFLDIRADITNVTFHELSHGFGAYHTMEVKTPEGKKTTVKEALGEHDSLMEELKADTMGLWLVQFEKKKGTLDERQQKVRYVSALMHILGLLQYPLPGTYPRMVAIQLGWYMDAGAVTWDADAGRFAVDFEKIPAAVESLVKEVTLIQLTGDRARAENLIGKYIKKKGEKEYVLHGTLGEAREVMLGKFKEAGIRSPSLRYKVTGL
ncbi:MAG: hypothetical protein JRG91_07975 [Deltaproteobacteria bacterium]|nr:hypothetical protein [Deltaproteobacteria bacterium]